MSGAAAPLVVGIGGTTRAGSSSQRALRAALDAARRAGAEVLLLGADDLRLPMYEPGAEHVPEAVRLVDGIRRCDGLLIASPGYHGGPSGLIKNALDYVEELRTDARPYLEGRAVGCIACAAGWQATTTTLTSLRSVVHALRGWPTPLGVAINSREQPSGSDGSEFTAAVADQLAVVAGQVVDFAQRDVRGATVGVAL